MLINISSDYINFCINNKKYLLENKNIEYNLSPYIKKIIINNNIKYIYILNGPGSFTCLRVSTTVFNILNFIYDYYFKLFSLSKIDFYKKFYDFGFLPSKGVIYIGQKNNLWLYDFLNDSCEKIKKEEIENINEEFFVDEISDQYLESNKKVYINFYNNEIILNYKGYNKYCNIESIFGKCYNYIFPNYLIEPSIDK